MDQNPQAIQKEVQRRFVALLTSPQVTALKNSLASKGVSPAPDVVVCSVLVSTLHLLKCHRSASHEALVTR